MTGEYVDLLRRREAELVEQLDAIRSDLSSLDALDNSGPAPVQAGEFLREPGDFTWLVGGLIADGSVTMVAAEPRIGKTTLLVDMALHLAQGRDWLGYHIPRRTKVLYMLAEGSRAAFRGRFRTACETRGVDIDSVEWWIQPADLRDFSLRSRELGRLLKRAEASLVVLDTKGYFDGFADENDAAAWKRAVMSPLRSFTAELGCGFVVVHHYGKAVPGKQRWERGRGSSAMFGDVDHWLGLEKVPLSDEEEEFPAPERARLEQRRELFVEKNKYGRDDYSERLVYDKQRGVFDREEM